MTARATMANLITTLRGFTNAGTADYSIDSVSHWSDDQLQTILDRNRINLREVEIIPHPIRNASGTLEYKEYQSPAAWLESTDGGTARFIITNGSGSVVGTASWSADYETGLVTFGSDQGGTARYLTGYAYDVYAAAADIWEQKAAAYAEKIDFSTLNHNIKRSHIVTNCERMAQKYASMATMGAASSSSADTIRGDRYA